MARVLITGITGQDGSYLAELLLHKGYEVHGLIRKSSTFNTDRIDHIYQDPHDPKARPFLHYGDLSNSEQLTNLIYNVRPDEIYHMGAQSHVMVSFDMPEYTGNVTGLGVTRLLEAIRRSGITARFYQASSSEMFGNAPAPQNESTPFRPRSPYGIAKVYAYWMTANYREAYGLFAANGILFNHESPRRGPTFLSRKVTRAIARVKAGGPAPTIREFVEEAFSYADLDWHEHVQVDPRYFRPTEVDLLQADASRARRELGWEPKITYKSLVRIMVDADLRAAGLTPIGKGLRLL